MRCFAAHFFWFHRTFPENCDQALFAELPAAALEVSGVHGYVHHNEKHFPEILRKTFCRPQVPAPSQSLAFSSDWTINLAVVS